MYEPVLVLNCGSSSIKFALFDAAVRLLVRKALWSARSMAAAAQILPGPAGRMATRVKAVAWIRHS